VAAVIKSMHFVAKVRIARFAKSHFTKLTLKSTAKRYRTFVEIVFDVPSTMVRHHCCCGGSTLLLLEELCSRSDAQL
jgi:hypothetical protein